MQESSGDELLRKLSTILRKHEDTILRGESKLCLTTTSVVYLNRCFEQLHSGNNGQTEAGLCYSKSSSPCVAYLHDLTKKALSLKLIPGPSARFDTLLSISHFKNVQYLEVKKVPLGYILGLQSLRKQLKGLTCMRSAFALNEIFICCGGDLSSTNVAWQHLREVNLSYNSIDHLDDSVKVLPAIEVLNLSHNNIASPEEEDCWQFLTGLQYLNLGYNQLNKVPSLPAVSITRFQLKILILRNNNIQDLRGIQHFGLLETLDVSNNCIASFQELFPLAHLHNLSALHLSGNPLCFYDDYRVQAVSCLSPVPHQGDMYLDNQKLSPLEKSFVGCSVQPASLLSYLPSQPSVLSPRNLRTAADSESVPRPESPQGYVDQPLVVAPAEKRKKKVRKLKARQISINKDVDEGESASSSTSSPVERSLEHSQDIERLKKARDLGGAHWLPAVNTVLHGENRSSASKTSSYQDIDIDNESDISNTSPYLVSQEHVTEMNLPSSRKSSSNESYQSDKDMDIDNKNDVSNISPYVMSQEPVALVMNLSSSQKSSSNESYQSDDGINQPFLVTLKALHLPNEEQEDEDDRDLLVTITEHFIRERGYFDGKVTCKLEIGSLVAANLEKSGDGEIVVHLKFDYLSRKRKERYYIMEDRGSAEQLIELLFPMIMSNEEAKNVVISEHLQCLKCSAYFTEQTSKPRDQHICPDCGSIQIIEVNPVEKSRDPMIDNHEEKLPMDRRTDVTTGNTWLNEAQKMPELIPQKEDSPTVFPQPDSYTYSKDNDINEKQDLLKSAKESTDTKVYAINNTKGYKINDSAKVKDLSLEKKDFNTELNGTDFPKKKENRNSYTINKTVGYVVYEKKNDYLGKSASPTRTSALSNSLKDSESKYFMSKSMDTSGTKSALQRRVIDSPISLKTSSSKPSTLETDSSLPRQEITPETKPTTPSQPKIPQSSPPAQPNVFVNLFSKLSNKMSGPLLGSSLNNGGPTPSISSSLCYEIPPDEFKECDHRLKLYFEVSLFTGGAGEVLSCLIKAPVVVYGDTEETCAVLVISNMAVYICKLVETAGLSADECLSLISSHSLDHLQYVDFSFGCQTFRLEFNGESPACYTFNVRDKNRCEAFLHLLIKSANLHRGSQELEPLKTTRSNPQTLAHIRSQVLGIQEKNLCAVGERFLEQLNHFTEPPLIKDRKSLLRSYPACFVGKEFIDWLIRYGEVTTRQEGVELAQDLVEGGVIEHVSKENRFEDKEQFYRFTANDSKAERSASTGEDGSPRNIEMTASDIDTHLSAFIMGYKIQDINKPLGDLKPVTIIVTRTHIALAEQNPQWPFPRYLETAPTVSGPQFHCIAKYKMTDVASLEFFSDSPCHNAIVISEEDGPLECADSYVLIKTETSDSLSSIVKAIREPWEEQFGVELQTTFIPSLARDTI
ncbi:serine/threonine-protein kinase 11-interacting protein-like [Actinia tenebrosa]|uniref:Serine/threonine-protein kinase 11-interacting protein n=1 Tax=Actinia tenebrosa TaxID=6105 RepID=A0A6P8HB94_ACTTE|nr:serine/threonine-protein kinase 11-interacting protein-like [Actinia tenebrosa]